MWRVLHWSCSPTWPRCEWLKQPRCLVSQLWTPDYKVEVTQGWLQSAPRPSPRVWGLAAVCCSWLVEEPP